MRGRCSRTQELKGFLDYNRRKEKLWYWRTRSSSFEVDFVLGDPLAVETKTTKQVDTKNDLKGLRALEEEGLVEKLVPVSRDPFTRKTDDGILLLPWDEFLTWLWEGKLL